MRASHEQIRAAGAEVLAIAPHSVEVVLTVTRDLQLPFPCVADPDRVVFRQYEVGSSGWSLGQRPAVFLIGEGGELERAWKGRQQWEIPSVDEILQVLESVDSDPRPR
jgi:peroxiredoxin